MNLIISALLCILIIGGNEVSLIITVGFVLLVAYSQYSRNRRGPDSPAAQHLKGARHLLVLSAICILFTIIEVTAPGNYMRIHDAQPFSGSVGWTIAGSVSITAVYLSQWLGPILAASVLYVPLFGMPIARKMREEGRSPGISLKHFLWYYLGAFSLIQVFIVWLSGGSSLGRIFDVIYLFFLLGYFFILQPVVVKYEHRLEPLQRFSAAFCWLGGVLFLFSLLDINNNISTAYVDLVSGKVRQYDLELTDG